MKKQEKDSKKNNIETTRDLNTEILNECHEFYANKDHGLVKIGKTVGINLLAPRRKIMVLLIGNHSAGKSSFINWYVGETIQKTGVAIETKGFTFVTSGKKRETLTGKATLHLHPHFRALKSVDGLIEYISTEVSPSTKNLFPLVTFIDSPGIVNGEMYYPYDVENAFLRFGEIADLILVFFDPIGQALCKKTVDLIEELDQLGNDKLRFFLSKADDAGDETDRQKVLMQIIQELCKRPRLNQFGIDIPAIYIPDRKGNESSCKNQIDTIHDEVKKRINKAIQNSLNNLERHSDDVVKKLQDKLYENDRCIQKNIAQGFYLLLYLLLAVFIPLLIYYRKSFDIYNHLSSSTICQHFLGLLSSHPDFKPYFDQAIINNIFNTISFLIFLFAIGMAWSKRNFNRMLSQKTRNQYKSYIQFIEEKIKSRKHSLYQMYLRQIVNDEDME